MSVADRPPASRPDPERGFGCGGRCGEDFANGFTMAFQPIVDTVAGRVFAYEALVRGTDGAGAAAILAQVDDATRYAFDQACRMRAIELAATLGIAERGAAVSINILPNAIYRPEVCIAATLATAARVGFPVANIIFEFTEDERTQDPAHLRRIVESYRALGFRTALDDFGAGYAGLSLLAEFQPDFLKIAMPLVRGLDADPVRRSIVAGALGIAAELGIAAIAEGVETAAEAEALRALGVSMMQGFRFAEPEVEVLPQPATLR